MRKVEDNGAQIIYRRGTRAAWWLVITMPIGMVILYLLGDRNTMHYLGLAFAGAVMFIPAAFDEHFVIDSHVRAMLKSETFIGRTMRSESIPFSQVTRVAVMPSYTSEPRKRGVRRDGFALMLEWTTGSGEDGIRLDTFWEDAQAMTEAEKLARILGTGVKRVEI